MFRYITLYAWQRTVIKEQRKRKRSLHNLMNPTTDRKTLGRDPALREPIESAEFDRPVESSHDYSFNQRFSLSARLQSFIHAIRGIVLMLKSQHNAWIHATASVVVLVIGACFGISAGQWCWLVIAIMAVWTAEALNTALEFLADVAFPEFHPMVEKAKDVGAGAVLISAVGSTVIALLVLGPYFMKILHLAQ